MSTGTDLRQQGIEANLAAAVAVNRDYRHHAEVALARLIRSGRAFTSDDVRKGIPAGMEGHHVNVLPSVIGTAAARREIVGVDRAVSGRRTRHGSQLTVWTGAKAGAA